MQQYTKQQKKKKNSPVTNIRGKRNFFKPSVIREWTTDFLKYVNQKQTVATTKKKNIGEKLCYIFQCQIKNHICVTIMKNKMKNKC